MILAIDFDGTIHDDAHPVEGRRMGPPIPGAKEALEAYRRKGHTIIIHTVRGGSPEHIEAWMKYYGIPFDRVTNIKPMKPSADLFIDDKARQFIGWDKDYLS